MRPAAVGYDVFDDHTDLSAGAGCVMLSSHHVSCAGSIGTVAVDAGGGDDVIGLQGVTVAVVVSAGAGAAT